MRNPFPPPPLRQTEALRRLVIGRQWLDANGTEEERLGPVLAACLLSELMLGGPEANPTALDRLELLWNQALGQRGRVKLLLMAVLTLHHRAAANVVAEVLKLD